MSTRMYNLFDQEDDREIEFDSDEFYPHMLILEESSSFERSLFDD